VTVSFGSAASALIAKDFTLEQRQRFTATKEILWESETATRAEVNQKEVEFILVLKSNDPAIGYNRWPKFKTGESGVIAAPRRLPVDRGWPGAGAVRDDS
jgi:hypothetical protein